MSSDEFDLLSKAFVNKERFLMAGVGEIAESPQKCGKNEGIWDMQLGLDKEHSIRARLIQKKHHRWKLDKSQILQYGLASSLYPSANWWEHIAVGERSLGFATLRPWFCLSMLICEDLARPDPVGDIIRAVGPNLIIALLSDGPQLGGRWPGRYAAALADDPGCSVLSVTSEGMSNLSRPINGADNQSRVVALWKDARTGTKELKLPHGASALMLNLSVEYVEEWTADGRGDNGWSGYPTLSAVHPISV
jgi:hypothetical protein